MNSLMQLSRQDKVELLELIAEKERRRQDDPLRYAEQHKKQQEATASMAAIRALFWGNRVGKTEWGAQETDRYATANHPYRQLIPPYEIWCACPSFDAQEETTQKKLLRYLPSSAIKHIEYLRGRIIKKMWLDKGIELSFKSYEQGREKFQGTGKRLIWFDEEPPRDIWEECFVRQEAGQPLDILLTMTAVKGMTWVYDTIYLATGNPDLFVSEAGWDDNPWLTEEQKQQMSRGLTASALKTRREGKFVKRVGLVCAWWERGVHLKHYDRFDPTWTWYEAIDGGFSDPLAYLLIGVDNDNNVHVVSGFREPQLKTARIAELRNIKRGNLTITHGWTDNDNPRLVKELEDEHIYLTPVEKESGEAQSWDDNLARKLEEYGQIQKGTGEPRLYISDSLIRFNEKTGKEENWLMQEIENLVWLERVTKQGEEVEPRWDDHRRFGHHFDGVRALAYFLISYAKPTGKQEGGRVVKTFNSSNMKMPPMVMHPDGRMSIPLDFRRAYGKRRALR